MKKGLLVVIDGIDGSGKTTQIELLTQYLASQGVACEAISFPRYGNNKYTAQIENYLKGKLNFTPYEIAKAYAGDRTLAKPQIEKWLREGKLVIANRYTSANKAHLGVDLKEDMPKPDFTILLNVDPIIGQKNVLGKPNPDIHEQNLAHLQNARKNYLKLSKQDRNWIVVNCMKQGKMKSPKDMQKEIVKIFNDVLISHS